MIPFRIGPIVYAVLGIVAIIAAWWLLDIIRESGKAEVKASYDQAIDATNAETITDNDAATKVALRDQRIRADAVAAYQRSLGGGCPLTAEEAQTLARIR